MKTILFSKMWPPLVIAALAAGTLGPNYHAVNSDTLTLKTANDVDIISFDHSKISETKLRQLILLSPFIVTFFNDMPGRDFSVAGSTIGGHVDKSFIALPLELCAASDPAYFRCDDNSFSGPNFLRNAKVNLQKGRKGLIWLERLDHPAELEPVVNFLNKSLELSVWAEETRFKYYSSWDDHVLKEVHEGIDIGSSCPQVFSELQAAASQEEKYRIVRFDWANCVVRAIDQQLGPYPADAWNVFLKAYGITEEHKELSPE